jgi:hypothetical protein
LNLLEIMYGVSNGIMRSAEDRFVREMHEKLYEEYVELYLLFSVRLNGMVLTHIELHLCLSTALVGECMWQSKLMAMYKRGFSCIPFGHNLTGTATLSACESQTSTCVGGAALPVQTVCNSSVIRGTGTTWASSLVSRPTSILFISVVVGYKTHNPQKSVLRRTS